VISRNGNLQSGEALVANDDSNLRPAGAQLTEPPDADPPVGWLWEGRAGDCSPYPDLLSLVLPRAAALRFLILLSLYFSLLALLCLCDC